MTAGGKCFGCGEFTGRYDTDRKRWACRACWPHSVSPLDELLRFGIGGPLPKVDDPRPERLPGESRQAWRKRCREGVA